ncbi:MAG: hypothetical protein HY399_00575 [Elusimicrobia bacterium]|nr:hypothetical protein [Elusimicrobiota bacterium]
MPTKNPRLQVVLEKPLYTALASLAKRERVSMSLKARDLIREALENLEDLALVSIVEKRAQKPGKLISLEEVEAHLNKK